MTVEMVIARNLLRDIELFLPLGLLLSAGEDVGTAALVATAWFMIFALFPLWNKDRLRAGDIVAGTWVVEQPRPRLESAMSQSAHAAGTVPPAYRFSEEELAVYGEFELQTLERVLRRRRDKSLDEVHATIARKLGRYDGNGDEYAFLEAFYTQLRARLESGMRMGRRKADKHS